MKSIEIEFFSTRVFTGILDALQCKIPPNRKNILPCLPFGGGVLVLRSRDYLDDPNQTFGVAQHGPTDTHWIHWMGFCDNFPDTSIFHGKHMWKICKNHRFRSIFPGTNPLTESEAAPGREFVDLRGLEKPPEDLLLRRPRTVIMSVDGDLEQNWFLFNFCRENDGAIDDENI